MDKIIAITGAGGVLCSAFAAHLAKNGARVALLDINAAAAEAAAEKINKDGGRAAAFYCDCLDRASVEAAHAEGGGADPLQQVRRDRTVRSVGPGHPPPAERLG